VSYQIEWKSHRQMREEVRLAAKIQQNLFPKTMPSINGYDFAGKSIPARIVGGDYYDFILINDHQLAVCLGDVSGKGLPASLIMANLQATMRGQLLSDCSPKNCMIHSNTLLYRSTSADKFVTFFYALLDTANHQLIYSNAGHDNPILMTKDGNIEKLATGGIVLGIMDDYAFEEKVIPFQVGDVLTIYSDGIVEAINKKKEMFGEDRLISILMKYHSVKAEQIIEEVFDAVKKYSGSIPQSDDITMIVVKRNV
jgi:sigma-B regulation protein RsbU (phosphoserine phosphatase)